MSLLVVDDPGRLYLRRYWEHQTRLVDLIRARVTRSSPVADPTAIAESLGRLYPAGPGAPRPDRPRWAAAVAALRPFCVISGGPGTGKTFTVVKILARLVEQGLRRTGRAPRITLTAPTGKAAARLPAHETVFARTVHKSQGSELGEVAVVLPPRPSPAVTRELLYTAVTRAKQRVTVYATPELVAEAVHQRTERTSGLRDALWGT